MDERWEEGGFNHLAQIMERESDVLGCLGRFSIFSKKIIKGEKNARFMAVRARRESRKGLALSDRPKYDLEKRIKVL